MLSLLVTLLVVCLVFGIIAFVVRRFFPPDVQTIALAIVGIIFIIVLVGALLGGPVGLPRIRW